ncbi:MAG: hypothetical protein GEU93_10290 [Propionibacteriales bacterium]|nr:hypothetical protein [Propionibacteriales bacterium]
MTNLAMLAEELRQFAGAVRVAGDDVAGAARQAGAAPVDRIGPAVLDSAVLELQQETTGGLDRLTAAARELDDALVRLAERSGTLAEGG